jgi:hypothetical protein
LINHRTEIDGLKLKILSLKPVSPAGNLLLNFVTGHDAGQVVDPCRVIVFGND